MINIIEFSMDPGSRPRADLAGMTLYDEAS